MARRLSPGLSALVLWLLIAILASPAGAVGSGSVSGTKKLHAVTQRFIVYYNYQTCSGRTVFKITSADVRWIRDDTDHLIRSYPAGKVGEIGWTCAPSPNDWVRDLTFTSSNIQFGCGGNSLQTCLKTFSWTTAPYLGCRYQVCGDLEYGGGWLKSTIYRRSTGGTLGDICGQAVMYGASFGCSVF